LAGCGSGSGTTANVVTVTVTPAAAVVVAGQQAAFTATVGGSTTTTVTWACTYTTTTTDSTGKTTTSTPASCDPSSAGYPKYGTLSDETQNVITYTAPALANFPSPVPTITLTAKATANTKKTGTTTITLDSGIRVSIAPTSVAVPVGLTPAQTVHFTASLLNSPPTNLSWTLVQPNTSSTTTANQTANPLATTCSPTCGTMDSGGNGIFTAPASLPTDTTPPGSKSTSPTTVYLVVNSKTDTNHYAVATISLVSATTNPVTFTGIYPTVVAAGGVEQDVFLNAHNILNTNTITFTPPGQTASAQVIDPSNIFTIPITAAYCTPSATGVTPVVTCDASIVTRIRLTQAQLAVPEGDPQFPATITVNGIPDPSSPGSTKSVSYPIHLVYASPALVAAVPNSIPLGTNTSFSTDGGYYGGGGSPLVNLYFNGQLNGATSFGPRQFTGPLPVGQIADPGLYPVSIKSNAPITPPPAAPPFSLATTNLAIQPTFSFINSISYNGSTPTNARTVTSMPFPGTSSAFPSSIVVNSNHQYALITEQGASALQIVDLSSGTPVFANKALLSCPDPTSSAAINCQPTSVSYTDTLNITGYPGDIAVVVNSAAQSLSLVSVPSGAILPQKVDLSKLLTVSPGGTLPTPYSVGVDPGTNLAVVAYSNSNVGFIVDLNPSDTTQTCFISTQSPPCAIAPVSLNTGATPQVVMQPQTPIAYVTPGGAGVTSVVNLLQSGTSANIASATNSPAGAVRTNSIVTITTTTPHGINPAVGGTVLISGVMPADLNGTYQVNPGSVTDPYTFSYTQTPPTGKTLQNETGGGGTVQYGSPYFTFITTSTATGATINPITRTFAFADSNATGQIGSSAQIGFINSLDQSVTSLTLTAGSCNGCTPNPSGAPESNFRSVAFDPYTNVLIAYNPSQNSDPSLNGNKISLINPGGTTTTGSSNVTQQPYRIIAAIPVIDQNSVPTSPTVQVGTGVFTSGTGATPITVQGPMAYDPRTRLVLVASAGSNTLSYMSLDQDPAAPFKKVQLQGMQVTLGGVANGQPPLGTGITAKCDPTQGRDPLMSCMAQAVTVGQQAQIRVFGEGFKSASPALARLDANSSVACGNPVDPNSFCTTVVSDTEVDVNIPASMLTLPHDYALDVLVGAAGSGTAVASNALELHAVGIQSLASACSPTTQFQQAEGVAIDDTRHIALVTNYACNSVSIINLDNTNLYNKPYGAILGTLKVGTNPIGVAVIPRLGYAVVANNGDTPVGTASIINISNPLSPSVLTFTSTSGSTTTTTSSIPVGLSPTGVAIDQDHAYALVANSGSSTVSSIDLTVLLRSTPTTPVAAPVAVVGSPKAIAIDPNRAIAVVATLQNSGTTSVSAGLDVISLSTSPPVRSSSASISSLTANLTSIVYDPAVTPALFYATSTQQNAVYAFNPDSGGVQTIRVGVNPYSIAYNYQTGTMLTINSTSNTSSVVDTQTFRTAENLGISSQSQFSAAMDNVSNTVVIADQNNNRVLLLAMPK
jgi:DNA-binding beta-propeller fold protein YncE